MKYIIYDETGLCLQDPNLKIYRSETPKRYLAKLLLETLIDTAGVAEEELSELKEAFVDSDWELSEEANVYDKSGKVVKYSISPTEAYIDLNDLYNTRIHLKISDIEIIKDDGNYDIFVR